MLARLLPVLWVGALLVGCAAVPPVQPTDAPFDGTGDNPVYVVCHGWHTGFVVPAAPLRARLPGVDQGLGRAPYLELGWGDAVFYRAREFRSGLALRAVFMATDSVVHVAPVPSEVYPFLNTPGVALLCLSDRQLASLLDFIAGSFHRDAGGRIVAASGGAPGRSRFYEGVGAYSLMNTCNTWTAKGLKSAGLALWPSFKLTADSVMGYLRGRHDVRVIDPLRWPGLLASAPAAVPRCPVGTFSATDGSER